VSGKLIVLAAIPGSGKTTWAEQLLAPNAEIVSSDAIREEMGDVYDQSRNGQVFNIFHARISWFLCYGKTVVADSTALTADARKQLRSVADLYGAERHLVYFSNVGAACSRNMKRERVVPAEAMERMLDKYENFLLALPQEKEHWDTITEIKSFT
jgi:predicted kinase